MKIIKPLHTTFVFALLVSKNFAHSLQKEISSVESSLIPQVVLKERLLGISTLVWPFMQFKALVSLLLKIIKFAGVEPMMLWDSCVLPWCLVGKRCYHQSMYWKGISKITNRSIALSFYLLR